MTEASACEQIGASEHSQASVHFADRVLVSEPEYHFCLRIGPSKSKKQSRKGKAKELATHAESDCHAKQVEVQFAGLHLERPISSEHESAAGPSQLHYGVYCNCSFALEII
jgi:hypothetical protein